MIMRRILGLIMLLTGVIILALSLAGAVYAGRAFGNLAAGIADSLTLAAHSLDAASSTLELARGTIGDVYGGLETAVGATASASRAIADSRPLIDNVADVTTSQVPEAVEGVQAALPNMIQVASVIDRTLVTLSSVGIDREIPLPFGGSIPLQFDLGIDYNPTTSFDDSLRVFQTSLDGLPESLRGLEDDLQSANDNLATLSSDLQATSDNLTTINTRVGELLPLLDQYVVLVAQLSDTVAQMETQMDGRLELLRMGVIGLLVAVGLSQLAPIYLGWELLAGRREPYRLQPATPTSDLPEAEVVYASPVEPSHTAYLRPEPEAFTAESPGDEGHALT